MSTHPADFAKQLEQSNWFNRMRDADMTRQEQTARPQDVALLPLPKWATLNAHLRLSPWALQQRLRDYARANVTAALASAQAREDELLSLVRDANDLSSRLIAQRDRMAESLREYGFPLTGDDKRDCWEYGDREVAREKRRRAALPTNAATQTGETNEAAE